MLSQFATFVFALDYTRVMAISAVVGLGIAIIANDNLQDLKTGYLVGSTPWKQQFALVLGVGAGSLVIPPVLDLLNQTMGFAGAPGAGPNALAAPQASLISSLAQGVLGFRPRRTFEDSLGELADWVREQQAEDRVVDARRELEQRGLVA